MDTIPIRPGLEPDHDRLFDFLKSKLGSETRVEDMLQFPGGFSNLTFLIKTNVGDLVLRRPPMGRKIATAHDMGREFRVLSLLWEAGFRKIPRPVALCDDDDVLGAPFFLMEKVDGIILRNRPPRGMALQPADFRGVSRAAIEQLAALHQLDLPKNGLDALGKPEGYIARQVEGWTRRYHAAQTDDIPELAQLADWLAKNLPAESAPAFLHNDYKYDNLVLDPQNLADIRAILDWEMATVGDPRMDLGSSLAYWAEPNDPEIVKMFGLTHAPGNFSRQEALDFYGEKTGRSIGNFVFFYAYGCLKLAGIAQQIYQRYKSGHAQDPRFALLIEVVRACARSAVLAIEKDKISGLFEPKISTSPSFSKNKNMENSQAQASVSPQTANAAVAQLFDLSGKVAIVTGASRGIGEAIAWLFGRCGAKVVLSSRKEATLQALAEKMRGAGIEALAVEAHAGDPEALKNLVKKTVEHFGGLDIVVNNAAVNPVFGPLELTDERAFDKIIGVNLKGPFELAKAAKPAMEKRGGGAILNISSIGGLSPEHWLGIYSVSKAALISLTKVMAKEWGAAGIRANAICPGLIETQFSEALWRDENILQKVLRKQAIQRVGTPDEIAALALFLCSDAAAFTTGAVFTADGGYTI